jgi:hypothetical protein
VATAAQWWRWHVLHGRRAGRRLPAGLYHELRYETLVAKPADECTRLCAFLGIAYSDAMLAFHEGRRRNDPGLNAKKAWAPVTTGLRSWETQLPREHVIRFEAAAGALLDELGYVRAASSIPRKEQVHAARIRERFVDEVRARQLPLPRAWSNRVDDASLRLLVEMDRHPLAHGRGRS